jgi:hypothetical protein
MIRQRKTKTNKDKTTSGQRSNVKTNEQRHRDDSNNIPDKPPVKHHQALDVNENTQEQEEDENDS